MPPKSSHGRTRPGRVPVFQVTLSRTELLNGHVRVICVRIPVHPVLGSEGPERRLPRKSVRAVVPGDDKQRTFYVSQECLLLQYWWSVLRCRIRFVADRWTVNKSWFLGRFSLVRAGRVFIRDVDGSALIQFGSIVLFIFWLMNYFVFRIRFWDLFIPSINKFE